MSHLIRPYQPVDPPGCEVLAAAVDDAIAHIRGLGVRINDASRLPMASRTLRAVVAADAFPSDERGLHRVTAAIKIAFDFDAIAKALPHLPNNETRDALVRATKGSLGDIGPTTPHRAQSQLRLGCVLAEGGLRPAVVQSSGRRVPDYLVRINTFDVVLETKRPERIATIKASVEEAVGQARRFRSNFLVVALDVSDAIRPSSLLVRDHRQAHQRFQRLFRQAADTASDYIHARKMDPGFDHVGVLFLFADATFWPRAIPLRPHSRLIVYPEVFHHAASGLVLEPCRRLRACLEAGIEALGGKIQSRVPAV